MTAPLLYPVPEACAVLGIGRSMLYELAAQGEIEFVKIGRKTLVPADSLQMYVTRLRAAHQDKADS